MGSSLGQLVKPIAKALTNIVITRYIDNAIERIITLLESVEPNDLDLFASKDLDLVNLLLKEYGDTIASVKRIAKDLGIDLYEIAKNISFETIIERLYKKAWDKGSEKALKNLEHIVRSPEIIRWLYRNHIRAIEILKNQ